MCSSQHHLQALKSCFLFAINFLSVICLLRMQKVRCALSIVHKALISHTLSLLLQRYSLFFYIWFSVQSRSLHTSGSRTTSFLADALNTPSSTDPSFRPPLAVTTHEDTLEATTVLSVGNIMSTSRPKKKKKKDLEVTEGDSQAKHSLGCVVSGLQDVAQKAVPKLLCCLQTILYFCFDEASEGSCPTRYI